MKPQSSLSGKNKAYTQNIGREYYEEKVIFPSLWTEQKVSKL